MFRFARTEAGRGFREDKGSCEDGNYRDRPDTILPPGEVAPGGRPKARTTPDDAYKKLSTQI